MPARSERAARRVASGSFSVSLTRSGSTTSTDLMLASSLRRIDPVAGLRIRSKFHLTASAVRSLPSWNFTPFRSRKTYVTASGCSQDSANSGVILRFASRARRGLYNW